MWLLGDGKAEKVTLVCAQTPLDPIVGRDATGELQGVIGLSFHAGFNRTLVFKGDPVLKPLGGPGDAQAPVSRCQNKVRQFHRCFFPAALYARFVLAEQAKFERLAGRLGLDA